MNPDYEALKATLEHPVSWPVFPTAITRGKGPPEDPEWPTPTTPRDAMEQLMKLSGKLVGEGLLSALLLSYPFSGGAPPEGSFPLVGWLIKEADTISAGERARLAEMILAHLCDTIIRRTFRIPVTTPNARVGLTELQHDTARLLTERFLRSWWSVVRRRFAFRNVASTSPEGTSLGGGNTKEKRTNRKQVNNGRAIEPSAAMHQLETAIDVPPLPERRGGNARGRFNAQRAGMRMQRYANRFHRR